MPEATRRRRADAERSIEAIVDAATDCFAADPDASMVEIAKAAGVGRVTLYAHFPSREPLLQAVVVRAVAHTTDLLTDAVREDEPADQALGRLLRESWQALDRFGGLATAATRHLDPGWLRAHHDGPLRLAEQLIARGREEGAFRTDLPLGWQVTIVYTLLHAAAVEAAEARIEPAETGLILERTVLGALSHG
jgi:AcrR family transcriptional regulator